MVSRATRQLVRQRAQFRCEYCHSPECLSPDRFTIDHIQPQSLLGTDDLENLALACHRCNERRRNSIRAIDPATKTTVPIFNPRQQSWAEHFAWTQDSIKIIGQTPIGRATCQRLDCNDDRYPDEDSIRSVRRLWANAGWHPPIDDPTVQD
jgi:5-methylcytosine-specific restriction endonuclease McrA